MDLQWDSVTTGVMTSYHFLGVVLSNTGSFTTAVKTLCQSALKVSNHAREDGGFMPYVLCSLYSGMVQPVMEYGCEN